MEAGQAVKKLHERVSRSLTARREVFACVEIGSGGWISRNLTAEPGSSGFYAGAFILTPNASHWPTLLAGCGISRRGTLRTHEDLKLLATVAGKQFGAHWVLVVDSKSAIEKDGVHIALLAPNGTCSYRSASLAQLPGVETSQCPDKRLVQYVLLHLSERLEEYSEDSP